MIPVTDPFMAGHEAPERRPGDFQRDRNGTPRVSHPEGQLTKPKNKKDPGHLKMLAYSRPSNFGKIIEDMYSVTKWSERREAYGFAVMPDLAERAKVLVEIGDPDCQQWKDEADKIVKAAKLAAKANLSADRGTHTHALTEDDDQDRDILTRMAEGEDLGLTPEVQRSLVACWRDMLERDGIEILAVEVPVVNDIYRAAGTTDRIGRLTKELTFRLVTGEMIRLPKGEVVDVDVKTGQMRTRNDGTVMYWQGYAVQVFLYASGVPYDTETDTRGVWEWDINQRWALIAHLDVLGAIDGNPSCDLILVDLEAGRRAADLCVAAKEWAREQTVFSVAQIVEGVQGASADAPSPAAAPSTLSPDTQIVEGAPCGNTPAPSTCSPESSPAAGEVRAGSSSAHSPAMSPRKVEGGMVVSAKLAAEFDIVHAAMTADPSRLALVDARAALCPSPDEGADWSTDEYTPLWEQLRGLYDDLDAIGRQWRSELAGQAKRRGVDFLAQGGMTERRFFLNRAIIAFALAGEGDDILRELLSHVLGDVALFPAVELGHLLGSLSAVEAQSLAHHVDAYLSPPPAA